MGPVRISSLRAGDLVLHSHTRCAHVVLRAERDLVEYVTFLECDGETVFLSREIIRKLPRAKEFDPLFFVLRGEVVRA